MTEQLYSVRELANHFDVGENYIFSMVRDGKLKAHETNPIKVSEVEVKKFYRDLLLDPNLTTRRL